MSRLREIPLFMPIFLIGSGLYHVFLVFPQWLIGYWWCDSCGNKQRLRNAKYDYLGYNWCEECKDKM